MTSVLTSLQKDLSYLEGELVRDKVPSASSLMASGLAVRALDVRERIPYLQKKILKDTEDLLVATSRRETLEGLASIIETLRAYATEHDIPWAEVNLCRERKLELSGSFRSYLCMTHI